MEFGFSGYMPGGWHPVAFVFVDIDPSLVDFNIHPAKKEVRFRNLPEVHRAVVAAVRKMLEPHARPASLGGWAPRIARGSRAARSGYRGAGGGPSSRSPSPRIPWPPPAPGAGIRFLGQVFGVFLVFELPGRLLLLDQHAAHEQILFERLCARAPGDAGDAVSRCAST